MVTVLESMDKAWQLCHRNLPLMMDSAAIFVSLVSNDMGRDAEKNI